MDATRNENAGHGAEAHCPRCGHPLGKSPGAAQFDCPGCRSSFCLQLVPTISWRREVDQDREGADPPQPTEHSQSSFSTPGTGGLHSNLESPLQLGRFDVLGRLGAGGFGTVYKARDQRLERVVALKTPHAARLMDSADRDRFVREARNLAQLRHPGIVPVYEVGEDEDTPFLVTEFVDGQTLAENLYGQLPSAEEAARLCMGIADALHHAHQCGIVHRDVKPSNIMLDRDGEPHLMDFGLAKQETSDAKVSFDHAVAGTPAYMSPEQAAGEAEVDRRTDIYSLGVVLYELLTGERPFRGNRHMLLQQVLNDEPDPPHSLNDRVPRDLEVICLKAISKEPKQRYGTAQEMADELQRFLRKEAVLARPASALTRFWLWSRRPERIGAASTITVAMSAMLALWEVSGLCFLVGGYFDDWLGGNRWPAAAAIVTGMITFSTLAGLGYLARRRMLAALWLGMAVSIGLLLFSLSCLFGANLVPGLTDHRFTRITVFSFFAIAAVFVVVSHMVSLQAYYANRSSIRWSRRSAGQAK